MPLLAEVRASPLLSGLTSGCVSLLLGLAQPLLLPRRELLLDRGQRCCELFMLQHGALTVSAADADSGGGAGPSFKKGHKFTAVERPGHLVGARDAYEVRGYRYPFVVKAAVACRLLRFPLPELADALGSIAPTEAERAAAAVRRSHEQLALSLAPPKAKGAAVAAAPAAAAGVGRPGASSAEEIHRRLAVAEAQMGSLERALGDLNTGLRGVPQLLKALNLDHEIDDAAAPVAPPPAAAAPLPRAAAPPSTLPPLPKLPGSAPAWRRPDADAPPQRRLPS